MIQVEEIFCRDEDGNTIVPFSRKYRSNEYYDGSGYDCIGFHLTYFIKDTYGNEVSVSEGDIQHILFCWKEEQDIVDAK